MRHARDYESFHYPMQLATGRLVLEIIPRWFILPVISFFISLYVGKCIYLSGISPSSSRKLSVLSMTDSSKYSA